MVNFKRLRGMFKEAYAKSPNRALKEGVIGALHGAR